MIEIPGVETEHSVRLVVNTTGKTSILLFPSHRLVNSGDSLLALLKFIYKTEIMATRKVSRIRNSFDGPKWKSDTLPSVIP